MKEKIQTYLERNLGTYFDILRQMVEINSFTGNPEGVNRVGDLTAELFRGLGFTETRIQAKNPKYGKHLVLTHQGTSGKRVGMISHLDTVFPPEEEIANDFHWREVGDRIYGPGTNDVKGGTVLMYMVLAALKEFYPRTFEEVTWVLLLNAAEERLSDDFGGVCLDHLSGDALAALVFEAGVREGNLFQLVTKRKGRCTFRVFVDGKGAHAGSNHAEGANAIVQLAHTIQKIAALTDYERDLTFNVGTVKGGSVVNRVPHFAQATVEMRAFDTQVFDDGVKKMLDLQNHVHVSNHRGDYQCKVTIQMSNRSAPWPENPATQQLFQIWQSAGEELGFQVVPEARGGLSDGNALWETIPTIDGLGPYGGFAHCSERSEDGSKDQEFASKSSFVPKTLLNVYGILKLIESS